MRYFAYSFIIAISIFIVACNNDSLNNSGRIIDFSIIDEILSDQSKNVIMPLYTNKKWYYLTTIYKANSEDISYQRIDSITVESLENYKNYKWYLLNWLNRPIYAVNTPKGLYLSASNESNSDNFLAANYPNLVNTYLAGKVFSNVKDSSGYRIDSNKIIIDYQKVNDFLVINKSYECLKFSSKYVSLNNGIISDLTQTEYYSVDIGLIKNIKLKGNYKIQQSEFIANQITYPIKLKSKPKYYDIGVFDFDQPINVNVKDILINNMDQNAVIYNISNMNYNCTYNIDFSSNLLLPGQSLNLNGTITAKEKNDFAIYFSIKTNRGVYEFALLGKVK